jgi:hypothetical protein
VIESNNILMTIPIMRSQTPPMWDECGGLKIQAALESER